MFLCQPVGYPLSVSFRQRFILVYSSERLYKRSSWQQRYVAHKQQPTTLYLHSPSYKHLLVNNCQKYTNVRPSVGKDRWNVWLERELLIVNAG